MSSVGTASSPPNLGEEPPCHPASMASMPGGCMPCSWDIGSCCVQKSCAILVGGAACVMALGASASEVETHAVVARRVAVALHAVAEHFAVDAAQFRFHLVAVHAAGFDDVGHVLVPGQPPKSSVPFSNQA